MNLIIILRYEIHSFSISAQEFYCKISANENSSSAKKVEELHNFKRTVSAIFREHMQIPNGLIDNCFRPGKGKLVMAKN